MTPVTISGQQPRDDDERAPECPPGKRRVNSKASANPITNWPTSDPAVNSNVWMMAVRLVGSVKDEAVICEPGKRGGQIGYRRRERSARSSA